MEKFCKYCGNKIEKSDSIYCSNCGNKLDSQQVHTIQSSLISSVSKNTNGKDNLPIWIIVFLIIGCVILLALFLNVNNDSNEDVDTLDINMSIYYIYYRVCL